MSTVGLLLNNCQAAPLADVPALTMDDFHERMSRALAGHARLGTLFAWEKHGCGRQLVAVLLHDAEGKLEIMSTKVQDSYPALTPTCPQAHMFEREIYEQFGILPEGHPGLNPVRFSGPIGQGVESKRTTPGVTDFLQVEGDDVHEVAVGPVHAGIIEPGHFRFQCHGERVFLLEIALGYQHRGIEKALLGGPDARSLHFMETLAGDSSIAHTTAHCHALEGLAGCLVPSDAQYVRGIALELERIANHVGDLGALANDVAYLPTASYCGRLRGDYLNMTAKISGNRFGRNLLVPGGVKWPVEPDYCHELLEQLPETFASTVNAVELLWSTPSVLGRFEEVGRIDADACWQLGIVGVPARACGCRQDIRFAFPSGIYRFAQLPLALCDTGDVFARGMVRWLEVRNSVEFLLDLLKAMPSGKIAVECPQPKADHIVVSLVEGWRGEICHVAVTDEKGKFARYKVTDPSFHNWPALALSLRNQEISDFPLCNKSFNLSYCGHDL